MAHKALRTDPGDDALLLRIGERVTALRLAQNLTQVQLAEKAGLGLRTLQRLEQGAAATQLDGFVRVCSALGVVEGFDALLPAPMPSPIAQLKLYAKVRQRASASKVAEPKPKPWVWGDET